MRLEELAGALVATKSKKKRENLLRENASLADIELAFALKNAAYSAWTVEPARAQNAALALASLAEFNPEPKIIALKTWIDGIAALTRGDNAGAVRLVDDAAERLRLLNDDHLAAQTQVAKLYALALLGRYDEAIEAGRSALETFEAHEDEFAAARLEHNLGNISWRRDLYLDAENYYQSAWRRYLTLDDQQHLAMLENSFAVIKTFQNDFRTAETLYRQALERARKEEMFVTEAEIEASMGNLALFRGKYDEALRYLEQSRRKYADLNMPHLAATAELELADAYLELNLIQEATDIYSRISPLFDELKMRAESARTSAQIAKSLLRLGKNKDATEHLDTAENLYEAEKNFVGAATVKLLKANLSLREEKFEEASELSLQAENVFAALNSRRNQLLSKFVRGESARNLGEFKLARTIFGEICKESVNQEQPQIVWGCHNSLGQVALAEGKLEEAEKSFKDSIEVIENLRQPLAADEFRTSFFADKLAPFQFLTQIYLRQNKKRLAFETVERARSQALLDLIGNENPDEDNSAFSQEIRILREELNWFYSRLNRPAFGEMSEAKREIDFWQTQIRERERRINELMLHAESAGRGAVHKTKNFNPAHLQKALGEQKVLLEFVEFENEIGVFVIGENEIEFLGNLGHTTEIERLLEQVHFQFGTLRYGTKALEKHLPLLKKRIEKHFRDLYEILLAPLEDLIGERHLVIVPSGALHYVPFHALYDGEKYVIEQREVSYAPSASVLLALLQKEPATFEKMIAAGFADERVPMVETEVQSLAEVFSDARILTGAKATFAAVRENLKEKFDILHLACHGQFRAENPLFSSLHLADGWATVRETETLHLPNALVVLSACETGLNKVAAGDELLGLVRGFLAAGAVSLLLTLWTVNDDAAAVLMREFYKNIKAGNSLATSLRNAQLSFVNQNYHPYFWSPFALVGRW